MNNNDLLIVAKRMGFDASLINENIELPKEK